jgi:hypothetical protein
LERPEEQMGVEMRRRSPLSRTRNGKRRSFRKTTALPGGIYAEHKRCNRPNCRCVAGGDALHGPYLYRRWVEDGRLRSEYVKASDAERVRAGLAEWRRLHPPARSARDLLVDLRRLMRTLEV